MQSKTKAFKYNTTDIHTTSIKEQNCKDKRPGSLTEKQILKSRWCVGKTNESLIFVLACFKSQKQSIFGNFHLCITVIIV